MEYLKMMGKRISPFWQLALLVLLGLVVAACGAPTPSATSISPKATFVPTASPLPTDTLLPFTNPSTSRADTSTPLPPTNTPTPPTDTITPTYTPRPTKTAAPKPAVTATLTSSGFGPEAVWNIDGDISKYQNCFYNSSNSSTSMECVVSLMQTSRASPQAVAFTKLLQGIAFMSSFTEYGIVDLAEITYPPRANNNVEYILVNGNPQIVYVEDGYKVDITHDSNYPALQQKYPNIQIGGAENSFINMEQNSQGGQRFIFSFVLMDGCHACQTDKSAYIAFEFEGTGQFEGMKLMYIK